MLESTVVRRRISTRMTQFQMTHVALVGARMDAFRSQGYRVRSELALCRVAPATGGRLLASLARDQLQQLLAEQLPLWVHNVIVDASFPERDRLSMSLRRFEGELRDNRDNEVVASVLSAGFRNRSLDPLNPPESMPMRQRCGLLMHVGPWRDAFQALQSEWICVLSDSAQALDTWIAAAKACPELQPEAAVAV